MNKCAPTSSVHVQIVYHRYIITEHATRTQQTTHRDSMYIWFTFETSRLANLRLMSSTIPLYVPKHTWETPSLCGNDVQDTPVPSLPTPSIATGHPSLTSPPTLPACTLPDCARHISASKDLFLSGYTILHRPQIATSWIHKHSSTHSLTGRSK